MRKLPPGISPKVLLPRVWHFMRCEGEAEPVSVDQYQSAWLAMLSARGGDGDERVHNLASEAGCRQHECVDEAQPGAGKQLSDRNSVNEREGISLH